LGRKRERFSPVTSGRFAALICGRMEAVVDEHLHLSADQRGDRIPEPLYGTYSISISAIEANHTGVR
jgi:hypothetical protein